MATPLRVLLVEDEPGDAELILIELARAGFDVTSTCVDTEAAFVAALEPAPDVVLADYSVPSFGALAALRLLRPRHPFLPFIVITGSLEDHAVVQCLREGASDYLLKDRLARLGPAITRALAERHEQSEKRKLEEQLLHAQRLESVGRLAGGIAHDFNNLLTVISGNAEFALASLEPGSPARSDILQIDEAARRAAQLTGQLLAFSRKQVLAPRVLQLNDTVESMSAMLRRLIGEDVVLELRLAPDLPHVRADPGQLEQVIVNLAVNARDAMPSGGQLTIETAAADMHETDAPEHAAATPGPHVVLTLTDTGTGMDAATKAAIFEPFFTTKPVGKGTGLGLATVYGIVRQSGGNVLVHSEPGHGTSFRIFLPPVDAPIEPMRSPATAELRGGTETLLLAEDEPGVRALAIRILERGGYGVLAADGGRAALELASQHQGMIDLVVTDVVMPGMSGRELHESLEAQRPGLPVLYLSGHVELATAHHGGLETGTSLLQKPFSPEALLRKVREVLDAN